MSLSTFHKRDRLNKQRHLRLLSKIQKANVLPYRDTIEQQPSWNKKFSTTARLRVITNDMGE